MRRRDVLTLAGVAAVAAMRPSSALAQDALKQTSRPRHPAPQNHRPRKLNANR